MVEVVFEDRGASAVWVGALLPISIGQACRRFAGTPVRPNVSNPDRSASHLPTCTFYYSTIDLFELLSEAFRLASSSMLPIACRIAGRKPGSKPRVN
jgi:hypothetical protein